MVDFTPPPAVVIPKFYLCWWTN